MSKSISHWHHIAVWESDFGLLELLLGLLFLWVPTDFWRYITSDFILVIPQCLSDCILMRLSYMSDIISTDHWFHFSTFHSLCFHWWRKENRNGFALSLIDLKFFQRYISFVTYCFSARSTNSDGVNSFYQGSQISMQLNAQSISSCKNEFEGWDAEGLRWRQPSENFSKKLISILCTSLWREQVFLSITFCGNILKKVKAPSPTEIFSYQLQVRNHWVPKPPRVVLQTSR